MTQKNPLPHATAVLFADQIIVESGTAKKTLVGLFSNIYPRRLPARRNLNIYAEISDAKGEYDFNFELAHLNSGQVIAAGGMDRVRAPDRLLPLEIVFRIAATFREYGTYEFRLLYGCNVFASRTFRVLPSPGQETGSEPSANGQDSKKNDADG